MTILQLLSWIWSMSFSFRQVAAISHPLQRRRKDRRIVCSSSSYYQLNIIDVASSLKLPQEPPAIVESNRVPAYWPSSSNSSSLIVVENLEVKYAPELPPVLHDVSFSLKGGERVGVLGRTGMCFQTSTKWFMIDWFCREWKVDACDEHFEICEIYPLRSLLFSWLTLVFLPLGRPNAWTYSYRRYWHFQNRNTWFAFKDGE